MLECLRQMVAKVAHTVHVCQQSRAKPCMVSGQTHSQAFNAGLSYQKPAHMDCTPCHAALEMLAYMGSPINAHISATAGDVWALGCIAFFIFTGSNPFASPGDVRDALLCCHMLHQQWAGIKIDSNICRELHVHQETNIVLLIRTVCAHVRPVLSFYAIVQAVNFVLGNSSTNSRCTAPDMHAGAELHCMSLACLL